MDKDTTIKLLCKPEDFEATCGMTARNIRKTYIQNPLKHDMLKCLDMGSFCLQNNVSQEELYTIVHILKQSKEKHIFKLMEVIEEIDNGR